MSDYDAVMRHVIDEMTRHRVEHFREPRLIELADADYDAVVAFTTYYDEKAETADDAKHYDPLTTPREGGTLLGVPVRAVSEFRRGHVRLPAGRAEA